MFSFISSSSSPVSLSNARSRFSDTSESARTSTAPPVAALTPTRPAEAFTVVFENEPAAEPEPEVEEPPVPTAPPLSQFVPSKIRKSFMQREQKRKPLDKSKVKE